MNHPSLIPNDDGRVRYDISPEENLTLVTHVLSPASTDDGDAEFRFELTVRDDGQFQMTCLDNGVEIGVFSTVPDAYAYLYFTPLMFTDDGDE